MSSASPPPIRILVVEDDVNFRETLLNWLRASGFDCVGAHDGADALALVRVQRFDVVVTDLKMPRLDGLQLLDVLNAQTPESRVIFLSGAASIDDVILALSEGRSFTFLRKPLLDLDVLNQAIARAIAARPLAEAPSETPSVESVSDHPILSATLAYIEAHFREPISLSAVASALGYSAPYLTDLVRRETGRTVQRWIIAYRLLEARRLLQETDWTIQRISQAVGYAHVNHFVRQFRQHNGMPPQAWRDRGQA